VNGGIDLMGRGTEKDWYLVGTQVDRDKAYLEETEELD